MSDTTDGAKLLCSIEDAMTTLSIGRTAIFDLLRSNEIDSVKIGRRRLILVASLHTYLDRLITEQAKR